MNIRGKQRYQNYSKAFKQLEEAVTRATQQPNDKIVQAGLIQFFEFTIEIAWKLLKDIIQEKGYEEKSPKEVIRRAFTDGIITDGDIWLQMLQSRNETSHLYDEANSLKIAKQIIDSFFPLFKQLNKTAHNDLSHTS